MYRIFLMMSVVCGLAVLSGCAQLLSSVSSKHDGSLINSKNAQSSAPNQVCNKWCHNGWCSLHCEDVVGSGN